MMTRKQILMTYSRDAREIWNSLPAGRETRTAQGCRNLVKAELDSLYPGRDDLFSGKIPTLLKAQGIDAYSLPLHLVA